MATEGAGAAATSIELLCHAIVVCCLVSCSGDMQLLPALLMDILRHNYSMVHIPWSIAHNSYPLKAAGNTWDTALPTMDAITAPQLAYDLWTTEQIRCACTAAHTLLELSIGTGSTAT
jgi:hypothetical protein